MTLRDHLVSYITAQETPWPRKRYTFAPYPNQPNPKEWWEMQCFVSEESGSRWQVFFLSPDHELLRGPFSPMAAYTARYFTNHALPFRGYEEYTIYVADTEGADFALAHETAHLMRCIGALGDLELTTAEEELAADGFAKALLEREGLPIPESVKDFDPENSLTYRIAYGAMRGVRKARVRKAVQVLLKTIEEVIQCPAKTL